MSRKFLFIPLLISICGIVIVTTILIGMNVLSIALPPNSQTIAFKNRFQNSDSTKVQKTAQLFFSPDVITPSQNDSQVDIMLHPGNNDIEKVQLEMKYSPLAIRDVVVTEPKNSENLFNIIDPAQGRISYAIALNTQEKSPIKIATITFQSQNSYPKTFIRFMDSTLVTTPNSRENILHRAKPLNIISIRTPEASQSSQVNVIPSIQIPQ